MKRSKAIKILAETAKDTGPRGMTQEWYESLAEEYLLAVEELGMVPPMTKVPRQKGSCLCTMRESCECCSDYHEDNRWDNE